MHLQTALKCRISGTKGVTLAALRSTPTLSEDVKIPIPFAATCKMARVVWSRFVPSQSFGMWVPPSVCHTNQGRTKGNNPFHGSNSPAHFVLSWLCTFERIEANVSEIKEVLHLASFHVPLQLTCQPGWCNNKTENDLTFVAKTSCVSWMPAKPFQNYGKRTFTACFSGSKATANKPVLSKTSFARLNNWWYYSSWLTEKKEKYDTCDRNGGDVLFVVGVEADTVTLGFSTASDLGKQWVIWVLLQQGRAQNPNQTSRWWETRIRTGFLFRGTLGQNAEKQGGFRIFGQGPDPK